MPWAPRGGGGGWEGVPIPRPEPPSLSAADKSSSRHPTRLSGTPTSPPTTTTITSRSTFGSPVGCESCLSSPFFSGLVQESQGQVATPEARISVGEAPARSQEDPQGKLLMSVSYSWAWPRPLGPNQRVSSPTWKGAEGEHLPLPICTASCVLELRLPTGAPLQEHVRR